MQVSLALDSLQLLRHNLKVLCHKLQQVCAIGVMYVLGIYKAVVLQKVLIGFGSIAMLDLHWRYAIIQSLQVQKDHGTAALVS